jgi:hypothetical protein
LMLSWALAYRIFPNYPAASKKISTKNVLRQYALFARKEELMHRNGVTTA